MKAYMTIADAMKVKRGKVSVGSTYIFYSDCVECKTAGGELIRNYSAQPVTVIRALIDGQEYDREEGEEMFDVRAANGDTFNVHESELNGWIFDTGQWVGPRVR